MQRRGVYTPESSDAAVERFEALGPAAESVLREATRAMGFDAEEYGDRVSRDVLDRAHEALFASLLAVTVGSRGEFEDWRADYDGEVTLLGSEHVDNVAWHAAPFGEAVAATFQGEPDAAVETLRRQAFGRVYRPVIEGD